MTDALRIRIYNVFFGDAILLSVPEIDADGRPTTVHALIDVGNALSGAGGRDEVFEAVLKDVAHVTGGAPLDFYVMTHEHMDHVQGLLHGFRKAGLDFRFRHLWMTASSDPKYYERFPKAKKKKLAALAALDDIEAFLATSASPTPQPIRTLLEINNPRATSDCVDHIRTRGLDGAAPLYVHRGSKIDGTHPFRRCAVRVLAPEEDTSIYYRPLPAHGVGPLPSSLASPSAERKSVTPPAGVSAGAFFDLLAFRATGMTEALKTLDKAANNTSVVLEFEWEGWRMLFPADAEERSWEAMEKMVGLRPVHFLKVGHHGSHNASPPRQIEKVLPPVAADARPRFAVLSTFDDSYPNVPHAPTLTLLGDRAALHDTRTLKPGQWFDVVLRADGTGDVAVGP